MSIESLQHTHEYHDVHEAGHDHDHRTPHHESKLDIIPHGEIGHVCTAECQHTQEQADTFAQDLFGESKSPAHGELGHVCSSECEHTQQQADKFADQLFDEPAKHDHAHGHPDHICTSECEHTQKQANELAEQLFEEPQDKQKVPYGHENHVCSSECEHTQQQADKFADQLFDEPQTQKSDSEAIADAKSTNEDISPPENTDQSGAIETSSDNTSSTETSDSNDSSGSTPPPPPVEKQQNQPPPPREAAESAPSTEPTNAPSAKTTGQHTPSAPIDKMEVVSVEKKGPTIQTSDAPVVNVLESSKAEVLQEQAYSKREQDEPVSIDPAFTKGPVIEAERNSVALDQTEAYDPLPTVTESLQSDPVEASAEYASDQVLADYDSPTPLTIDEFEDNAVLIDDFEGIGTQEQDFYTADSPLTEVEMEEGDFFYSKDESEFDSHDLAADFHGIEQSSLEVHDSEFDESDSAESSYSALMQSLNPDYASSSFGVNPELEPVQTIDISTEINQIFSEISTEDTVVRDITNTIENMDVRQTKHVVVTLQKLEGLSKTYESAEANETDVDLLPILERLSDQLDIDIAVLMQLLGISDTNERLSPQAIETIKRLQRLMQEQLQAELTQASNTSSTTSETTIKRLARYAVKLIKGPLHQQETLTA